MEFHPYQKEIQLKHQKEKDTPKYKRKRYTKKAREKNKNIEMFHGRRIPHWKQRGSVTRKEANKTLRYYGECCAVCGFPDYSLHHVMHKGYGIGGRGVWTNLVPLCEFHHTGAEGVHKKKEHDEYWKKRHEKQFGPHYYKDKYDLWMEGLIENPTNELYEKFMAKEIENCEKTLREGDSQENAGWGQAADCPSV